MPPSAKGAATLKSPRHAGGSGRAAHAEEFTPSFSPDLHIGTALRETFRTFARALAANEAPLGLSISMWFVLRALWEEDGLSQAALARRIEILPAAMVSVINALEKAQWVERRRTTADRRIFALYLTPKGRALRKEATQRALQVDARALRRVSPEQINLVLDVLAQLRRNLSSDGEC